MRLYTPMVQEPEDAIDPNLMTALDALMAAYSADFTLGEIVREVDLQASTATRCPLAPATSRRPARSTG